MSKLLFVVHRYAPFPGGSEYYVQDMAEKCLENGHDVTVLTETHIGDLNGVVVTSDYQILTKKWDLIIVHGADCSYQNIVHQNALMIDRVSPVLYLIIKPSESEAAKSGLKHHRYIGYSTSADLEFLNDHAPIINKRHIPHGIVPSRTIKYKHKNPSKFIAVSAGGFWPHKGMKQLVEAWKNNMTSTSTELHLYGYGCLENAPADGPNVFVHKGSSKDDVLQSIANADIYIMNSFEEGFGLVLLESMFNKTPWFARDIAGARDLRQFGNIYSDEDDLFDKVKSFMRNETKIEDAFNYVSTYHSISDTVQAIENVLLECM